MVFQSLSLSLRMKKALISVSMISCVAIAPSVAVVGDHWTQSTGLPTGPRARFPVLVFDDKMWILGGGYTGAGNNDVYCSVDGIN